MGNEPARARILSICDDSESLMNKNLAATQFVSRRQVLDGKDAALDRHGR